MRATPWCDHDREGHTDFRQAVIGQFLRQRHGHLTGARDGARTPLGKQIGDLDLVVLGGGALNIIDADQLVLQGQQILERLANQLDGDVAAHEVRVSDHAFQRTFQLTHVGANALSDEERGIVRQIDLGLIGLLHQDRYTGFQLGGSTATVRPQPKRDFKRSSRPSISFG